MALFKSKNDDYMLPQGDDEQDVVTSQRPVQTTEPTPVAPSPLRSEESSSGMMVPQRTQLGASVKIKGDIASKEGLVIDGKVEGNIVCAKQVTVSGMVVGNIKCESFILNGGTVKGNL